MAPEELNVTVARLVDRAERLDRDIGRVSQKVDNDFTRLNLKVDESEARSQERVRELSIALSAQIADITSDVRQLMQFKSKMVGIAMGISAASGVISGLVVALVLGLAT